MLNSGQKSRRLTRKSGFVLSASLLLTALFVGLIGVSHSFGQDSDRKVIARVEPEYPDALKKLYIGGVVRVEVQVSANGTVKNVKLLGGNPILGQSSMKAVKAWKYAPGPADEILTVKFEFDPHR